MRIGIFDKQYLAHRLAWLIIHAEWPLGQIDHKNHNRLDNRICNLREVSAQENRKNSSMQINNTSGVTGVCFNVDRKKWQAGIKVNKKLVNLGRFESKFGAIRARVEAERKYKFHRNHGRNLESGIISPTKALVKRVEEV